MAICPVVFPPGIGGYSTNSKYAPFPITFWFRNLDNTKQLTRSYFSEKEIPFNKQDPIIEKYGETWKVYLYRYTDDLKWKKIDL